MPVPRVNLYSDTQTTPTAAMRRAMAEAEVGDEQLGADPTVNALCAGVGELLGMEAAVFLPSGTMCNEIAIRVHVRAGGDAVFLHRRSHPLVAEAGGPSAFGGAVTVGLDGPRGAFDPATLEAALFADGDRYLPRNRLVCVEQTANLAGGCVWPLDGVRSVLEVARGRGMLAHLDGARLMNAVVASGVPAAEWVRGFDSAWIDFTKGLGAPLGAVLAGPAGFVEEAWRYKQMIGGALRQAGIVAAGCLHALDHHVDRLADDHALARELASGLAGGDGLSVDPAAVDTNIVVFGGAGAAAFRARLADEGVAMSQVGPTTVRAITHLDVDAEGVRLAVEAARRALA